MSLVPSVQVNLDEAQWTNTEQLQKPRLTNKCYFLVLKQDDNLNNDRINEVIQNLTKILNERPKIVLEIRETDKANLVVDGSNSWIPWIVLSNYNKVAITCPGCGVTKYGLWNRKLTDKAKGVGSFSKNLQQPVCCNKIEGKELRITHVNWGKYWNMNANNIDTTTYHGYIMKTFLQKYQIRATFLDANFDWGTQDEETKLWTGMVGNVSKYLTILLNFS